jgi:hypothetical protein
MTYKGGFTKIQAILGTILVWLPILMPVLFSISRLIQTGHFNFDFLMPAEMFVFVLAGAGLLLWAAVRAQAWLKLLGWSTGLAIGLLVAGAAFATFTGLTSGETEPAEWMVTLVIASLVGYILMVVVIGVGGVLLMLNLFKPST